MKILGLIGGTSWVSNIDYYKAINEGVNKVLGGDNFAECIIYSFNYEELVENNARLDFEANYKLLLKAANHLKNSGAMGLVLCANTLHMFADRTEAAVGLPVIHIGKATAAEIKKAGLKKVGLLGTKFTMEMNYVKDKLTEQGLETIIPTDDERAFIHQTIFGELGKGITTPETKARYLAIIANLQAKGAEGVILGC